MVNIYINEEQLSIIKDNCDDELTFYEFVGAIKEFIKGLLKNPNSVEVPKILNKCHIGKHKLIKKLKDNGIIKCVEKIDEVLVDEGKHPYGKQLVAKRFITYKVPKARFSEKLRQLYCDLIEQVELNEDEGGATSCGSVMQGGGSNPSAGQYEAPLANVQRRSFWKDALSRKNKDSISMNHV